MPQHPPRPMWSDARRTLCREDKWLCVLAVLLRMDIAALITLGSVSTSRHLGVRKGGGRDEVEVEAEEEEEEEEEEDDDDDDGPEPNPLVDDSAFAALLRLFTSYSRTIGLVGDLSRDDLLPPVPLLCLWYATYSASTSFRYEVVGAMPPWPMLSRRGLRDQDDMPQGRGRRDKRRGDRLGGEGSMCVR